MKTKREYLIDLELDSSKIYSQEELKKQYKKLSRKYHADLTDDSEKHRIIVEAYQSLKSGEYLPEEVGGGEFISIETLHESLFSMIDRGAVKIDLKKSDNNVVKIDNNLIFIDDSKLTKPKTVFLKNKFYRVEK